MRTVEAREGLHGLDTRRGLSTYMVCSRALVACLELVGADEKAVGIVLDSVGDFRTRREMYQEDMTDVIRRPALRPYQDTGSIQWLFATTITSYP
jgi:hypothetical protein